MIVRVPFRISIITLLLTIIFSLTVSMFIGVWLVSSRMADFVAGEIFEKSSQNAQSHISHLLNQTLSTSEKLAKLSDPINFPLEAHKSRTFPFLVETLRQTPALYSLYYGFENHNFFQLIAVRNSSSIRIIHNAPENTHWIVRTITDGNTDQKKQTWTFLNDILAPIGGYAETQFHYDPTKRPWYENAYLRKNASLSAPYYFSSLQKPGITASKTLPGGEGVLGVDLTLSGLSEQITSFKVSENGGVILFDSQMRLIANSSTLGSYAPLRALDQISVPNIQAAVSAYKNSRRDEIQLQNNQNDTYYSIHSQMTFPGTELGVSVIAPTSDFEQHRQQLQSQLIAISFLAILFFIPIAYAFSARLAKQVIALAHTATRMKSMEFDETDVQGSRITEFNTLITSFKEMASGLAFKTKELEIEQNKLSRLVDLGVAISAEKSTRSLMDMLLEGAKEFTNADGGTLYTIEGDHLHFRIVKNDSLGIYMGGLSGDEISLPPVALYDADHLPNMNNVVSCAVHTQKTIIIEDAYNETAFDFSGTKFFDKANNYHSKSFLTVPLKPRGGEIIGAIQLINAKDDITGNITEFTDAIQPFVEALSAQAATALYNRTLLDAQENMMDSLIHLIAGAVDAKSPYTGGHCERVPLLATMLAKAASASDEGKLATFELTTKDEWREFEIAAWLHDCGKVVTPEYVVDKATKLETIYNRIHEIRTRFEVLLRDAEIAYYQSLLEGGDKETAAQTLARQKAELQADFAFVAECNVGGEFMAPEKIDRLHDIAQTTWTRHFDIRLGLSHEESEHYLNQPDAPCTEQLLADKPFHIIHRERPIAQNIEAYKFKVDVPEHLYNRGELYNLCVKAGTLTAEERFKINEHVMQSIIMLEQLPLPKHLQRIPEYAGGHHETLIGTGYPRGLSEEGLSIPARIMAIADVFEALTASDRPYKKPKTLSQSIDILAMFRDKRHIDPDLFDLFLTSGIYKDYGYKFLQADQIDEVDIDKYLTSPRNNGVAVAE